MCVCFCVQSYNGLLIEKQTGRQPQLTPDKFKQTSTPPPPPLPRPPIVSLTECQGCFLVYLCDFDTWQQASWVKTSALICTHWVCKCTCTKKEWTGSSKQIMEGGWGERRRLMRCSGWGCVNRRAGPDCKVVISLSLKHGETFITPAQVSWYKFASFSLGVIPPLVYLHWNHRKMNRWHILSNMNFCLYQDLICTLISTSSYKMGPSARPTAQIISWALPLLRLNLPWQIPLRM